MDSSQNLSGQEILAIRELRSSPHVRLCKTDKGIGPWILLEHQQLFLSLHDCAGTIRELIGVSMDAVVQSMNADFQIMTAPLRKPMASNKHFLEV